MSAHESASPGATIVPIFTEFGPVVSGLQNNGKDFLRYLYTFTVMSHATVLFFDMNQ